MLSCCRLCAAFACCKNSGLLENSIVCRRTAELHLHGARVNELSCTCIRDTLASRLRFRNPPTSAASASELTKLSLHPVQVVTFHRLLGAGHGPTPARWPGPRPLVEPRIGSHPPPVPAANSAPLVLSPPCPSKGNTVSVSPNLPALLAPSKCAK